MQLSLQNFNSLVQTMAASVQASSRQLLDLTVGSVLRAILESNASIALWIQWLIIQVLQTSRAATSTGSDLDSWMADFGITRLPSVAATGIVTFSRFTPLAAALIPVGALVRTADGTQTFSVIGSAGSKGFSTAQNGYVVVSGLASFDVPVQAQVAGLAGNVLAGSVTLLASAMPGIDTVSNAVPFVDGADAESDVAFRSRFTNYLDSRSRATPAAIGYAINSIQQGLQHTVIENIDSTGSPRPGSFLVTVDDGTGSPSQSLLAAVSAAVESVRPIGSIYAVGAPSIVNVTISLGLTVAAALSKPTISASVTAAITSFVNALPVGAPLSLTRVAQIAYATDPAVVNVSNILLNGNTSDISPPLTGAVKAALVTVS